MLAAGLLGSCARVEERDAAPTRAPDVSSIPDAVPRDEPPSRYGNPTAYEVLGRRYSVMSSANGFVERGIASWYGTKFHGRRTSSGEPYDMYAMTAAHKTLPLPTYVAVTNLENGRRVVLKVNDRGPFHDNRVIDLSYTAAVKLDIHRTGTGLVEVRAVEPGEPGPADPPAAPLPGVRLYLQAGAFTARSNADRLRARLEPLARGQIHVSQAVTDGRSFYRVRLGPIADVDAADGLAERLRGLGLESPQVVVE